MARQQKIRPARMAAFDVQWGDVIVRPRSAGGGVIGTVIKTENKGGWQHITYRAPSGEVEEMRPVAEERDVWVHVPAGSA